MHPNIYGTSPVIFAQDPSPKMIGSEGQSTSHTATKYIIKAFNRLKSLTIIVNIL